MLHTLNCPMPPDFHHLRHVILVSRLIDFCINNIILNSSAALSSVAVAHYGSFVRLAYESNLMFLISKVIETVH
jgi:hypothetical protein